MSLPLPFIKKRGQPLRLFFMPQTLSLNFDMTTRRSVQYDRAIDGTLTTVLVTNYSKDALYTISGAWRPLDPIG